MSQTVPPFADLLAGCTQSAVHLEMRDVYGVENEDAEFAAWQAGYRPDPQDRASWWNDFHSSVAAAVSRGVVVRRARVVSEPVTDYIRFEHDSTFQNLVAGEDVRWLPRSGASDLLLPGNDLWLFDNRLIRFGLFSGDGRFVGHTLTDDPAIVERCVAAFEAVWERAVPHADYQV